MNYLEKIQNLLSSKTDLKKQLTIAYIILFLCLFVFIFICERKETKLLDYPDCYRSINYCKNYNDKVGVNFIKKQVKNMTIGDSCTVILNTLSTTRSLVYWRQSFLLATYITIIFMVMINYLSKNNDNVIQPSSYIILFLLIFLFTYFYRSYYDFHYLHHFYNIIENSVKNIENNIK